MGLEFGTPPRQARAKLRDHLSRVLGSPTGVRLLGAAEPLRRLDVSSPHAVHVTGLSDILAGRLLGDTPDAWRYIIERDGALAAVEIAVRPEEDSGLAFGGLNRGPLVEATLAAMRVAQDLPAVAEADYQLRLLKVPALNFDALWLHGPLDILLSLARHATGLSPLEPHEPDHVLSHLRAAANRYLPMSDDDTN